MKAASFAKKFVSSLLLVLLIIGFFVKNVLAQSSSSVLYVPLIGLTSVPSPLALPNGAGYVTYNYAVKNFLKEEPLTDIQVIDDTCSSIRFVEGDDNGDSKLDYSETWRYKCTTKLSQTTQSVATAFGHANNITATHKAYSTIVVGQINPAPLVSIINVTKIAYPLSLPIEGGKITFTYKVNNPGEVSLSDVVVTDDKCHKVSSRLGDTNSNGLLDINEVWIYTCTTNLIQTTTNTVNVTAFANGLKAIGSATVTVKVEKPPVPSSPDFPNTGERPDGKFVVWEIMSGVLIGLIVIFVIAERKKRNHQKEFNYAMNYKKISRKKMLIVSILIAVFLIGAGGAGTYFFLLPQRDQSKSVNAAADKLFGWKFPLTKFPLTGSNGKLIAYSSIRDPGGIAQGLPVRLKIPAIGVDSAIEDAYISPDGRMDVPAGSVNVAWFSLGPHPGAVGSAVIGGHFGVTNGVPFVFYNLDKLKSGDKIFIVDDKDDTLAFVVRSSKSFDRNGDATSVFTSQDGLAHLNLITCEGVWNQANGAYPTRLVVFTDAIPAEGSVTVNKQAALSTKPKVATNVVLTPTKEPIATPTSIIREKTSTPRNENKPLSSQQVLIASAKSMYATPIDGLITSFLLASIVFVTFKIVRRKSNPV